MKYVVNWTLHMDGKTHAAGDVVDLSDAQHAALNGSEVVTPIAQVADIDQAPPKAERKATKTTGKDS